MPEKSAGYRVDQPCIRHFFDPSAQVRPIDRPIYNRYGWERVIYIKKLGANRLPPARSIGRRMLLRLTSGYMNPILAQNVIPENVLNPILAKFPIAAAIFVPSLPRIGQLRPFSSHPCQGLDSCGHFHPILAKDWTIPTIFIKSLPRIGRLWPFSSNPCQGLDSCGHFRRILAKDWVRPYVF